MVEIRIQAAERYANAKNPRRMIKRNPFGGGFRIKSPPPRREEAITLFQTYRNLTFFFFDVEVIYFLGETPINHYKIIWVHALPSPAILSTVLIYYFLSKRKEKKKLRLKKLENFILLLLLLLLLLGTRKSYARRHNLQFFFFIFIFSVEELEVINFHRRSHQVFLFFLFFQS